MNETLTIGFVGMTGGPAAVVTGSIAAAAAMACRVPVIVQLAHPFGFGQLRKNVRATENPVFDLEIEGSGPCDPLSDVLRCALDEDACEAIVFGCPGLKDLARDFPGCVHCLPLKMALPR